MAHLLYATEANENARTLLLLRPYASAPAASGVTEEVDLLGARPRMILLDLNPGAAEIPEGTGLLVTAQVRNSATEDWQDARDPLVNIADGASNVASVMNVQGTPFTAPVEIDAPFPAGLAAEVLVDAPHRFMRLRWEWTGTPQPLLLALVLFPNRMPVPLEWEVA